MERMDQASRHMSNARRHLITAHRNLEAHVLAVAEVRLALAVIEPAGLESTDALDWVRQLRAAVEGESIDADLEDGRTLHIPVEPGRVFFVPPGSRETAVNRSRVRFREILVELKS